MLNLKMNICLNSFIIWKYQPGTNNQIFVRNDNDNIIAFPQIDKNGNGFYYDNCLQPLNFSTHKRSFQYFNSILSTSFSPVITFLTS